MKNIALPIEAIKRGDADELAQYGLQELTLDEIAQRNQDKMQLKQEQNDYRNLRLNEYPSVVEQLDLLYHQGYEGWKAAIEEIKLKYPKVEDDND